MASKWQNPNTNPPRNPAILTQGDVPNFESTQAPASPGSTISSETVSTRDAHK